MTSSRRSYRSSSSEGITRLQGISSVLILLLAIVAGWYLVASAPFSLQVTTRPHDPEGTGESILSLVGQRVMFLVVVEDASASLGGRAGRGQEVDLSASVPSELAEAFVNPVSVSPGQVAEIAVVPKMGSVDETFTVTITGERLGVVQSVSFEINVIAGEDERAVSAREMRDRFVPWLALNHPEFGIHERTQWTGTIVKPRILVVMHYIFLSEEWEMYLTWHVTIAPHDWARIYLRHRSDEVGASWAFEISSVANDEEPKSILVPDWI